MQGIMAPTSSHLSNKHAGPLFGQFRIHDVIWKYRWILLRALQHQRTIKRWSSLVSKLYVHFMLVINCPNGGENGLTGQEIAKQIPVLVCTIGLAFRYLYVLIRNSIRAIKARSAGPFIERVERRKYGTPYNIQYVKNLLAGTKLYQNMSFDALDGEPSWKTKIRALLRQYIYVNDPTLKYSPRIIGIFTVALICSYQFGIIIVLGSYQLEKLVQFLYPNTTAEGNSTVDDSGCSFLRLMVNTVNVSALLSFILSSLLTLFSIFQILTNYRHNIKLMFKGIFNHLPLTAKTETLCLCCLTAWPMQVHK
ncbi:uncharacterized protein LOC127845426 isoform X1 [Dreissena polymorpha]|uniref:uncharacterized protein LOC127845426 isoform X1 n=1 Tax=Dreissena polymorpha TaxID=45954 RepID=UPI002264B991|nr:uncharacterized protein LOC127845426 isoform X1 [Dreissena polymorpha]